ncbi:MAG: hypothetical protein KJO77_08505 [Bacteroidia bacterium]|nr:hypothetical protein [Bacteroidia bacterium]NND51040.1 hypothetical protein [Flavobacteriaceae bacterium]
MRTHQLFRLMMLMATSLLFVHCTSEYTPIPGEDGVDGIDGVDGTASCIACHSNSVREPILASYELSQHGIQTTMFTGQPLSEYTNDVGSFCVKCHTNEGYLEFQETGGVMASSATPTRIDCHTCHDVHESFDFENDGLDYALKNDDPVILDLGGTTLDLGDASNNCISCHQPRNSYAIPMGSGTYEITSKRFGPHHGPQSTILEGILGAEIAGSIAYPAAGSATHRTDASCVSCHMGESEDISRGLHSWVPTESACLTCHTNGAPTEASGFTDDMETLRALLEANNMFDEDGYYNEGTYSVDLAQAAWNYRTLLEDKSKGIHNPDYTKALIRNSIEALQD